MGDASVARLANALEAAVADVVDGPVTVAVSRGVDSSLVAMLAAQRVPVDAIVSIAGAGRSIDKVLITQLGEQLKSMPELRDHAFAAIEELAAGQTVQDYPEELKALFKPSIQGFLISWMQHDPVKVIATLEIPILIVQGTRDIQILVEDAEVLKKGQSAAELVLLTAESRCRLQAQFLPAQEI